MQLMDGCGSRQMNFRSFTQLFGIMSRTTLQERLKLLYTLHVEELTHNRETVEEGRGSLENSSNTSQTGEKMSVTFEPVLVEMQNVIEYLVVPSELRTCH